MNKTRKVEKNEQEKKSKKKENKGTEFFSPYVMLF